MGDTSRESLDAERFTRLVVMLQMAAMQQMGKIADPVAGRIERHLEMARETIDTIDMLERRTRGRRSVAEDALLEKVLFELRMNFVEESERRPEDAPSGGGDATVDREGGGDVAGGSGERGAASASDGTVATESGSPGGSYRSPDETERAETHGERGDGVGGAGAAEPGEG